MDCPTVLHWVADLQERFEREMFQAIRRRNMDQALEAMGGYDACERIKREIEERWSCAERLAADLLLKRQSRRRKPSAAPSTAA